jgi:hypothetical protein
MESWALVKGGNELLTAETASLFRGLRRGLYGFKALTDRAAEARRRLGPGGAVIERVALDDIVFFLSGENGHA